MRVRRVEVRLIALSLTALWTLTAALVLLGYRPGGPLDLLVGLAVVPMALIALIGLAWPPEARPGGPHLVAISLGVGAGLLLIASLGSVMGQLAAGGPQTLLPSLEAAYPWGLALLATAVFGGIGIARRLLGPTAPRRRRLAMGAAIGISTALITGALFGATAIANEVALTDQPSATSRYGPTAGPGGPPACTDPLVLPASAAFETELEGTVDTATIGEVGIDGSRNGDDFLWQAAVASDLALGRYGAARIDGSAWTAEPRDPWQLAAPATVEDLDLDRRFVRVALAPDQTAIAQDLGLAMVGGARARHCRIATDGARIGSALPVARWIVDGADIGRWRGDIDYYLFLDGSVGLVRGSVNGEAFVLNRPGLLGTLAFELTVLDRSNDITVEPPVAE